MNQTKKHTAGKKFLALLLALIMTVSLLPVSVFATEPDAEPVLAEEEVIGLTGGESGEPDAATEGGTETPAEEPVEEPVENPVEEPAEAPVEEPVEAPVEDPADTQALENGLAVQTETTFNYVEKKNNVPLHDAGDMGYRIVHIDCGRKYFSDVDLKKIIGYAAENHYTHVELAFGNDGLRFLLDDMGLTDINAGYTNDAVKNAIQVGNEAFGSAGELTEKEMGELITYANGKGIGIIPMFDAPGHLQAVVRAMEDLGLKPKYTTPTTSGTSVNYAIDPTDATAVNFVQALMKKYITYFAGKGCTMFNIAGDECGFYITTDNGTVKQRMSQAQYTAYAKMVNSMAAMVQNAGMTALAFNDGIYHKQCTLDDGVSFDNSIAICYWDASSDKYASAATLAGNGFQIINTNNKWYYVIGKEIITGSDWSKYAYTCEYAKQQMSSENSCLDIDGDNRATTPVGCMAAIWCDNPSAPVTWANVESYIKTLANNNTTYFKAPETPKDPELTADKKMVAVGGTVTFTLENYTGEADGIAWKSSDTDVLELKPVTREKNSIDAYALSEGEAEVTATVDNKAYSASVTVTAQQLEQRTITVPVSGTATDTIAGEDYSGKTFTPVPEGIATVSAAGGTSDTDTLEEITSVDDLVSGAEYVIYIGSGSSKRQLTNTVGTGLNVPAGAGTMNTGISLNSGTPAITAGTWKITKAEEGYYVQAGDGKYLTISNAYANTQSTPLAVTLAYNAAGYWTISQGSAYLNHYGNRGYAGGWDGRNSSSGSSNPDSAAKDGNSQWHIQKVVPAGTNTTVTFTGVEVGTTYVTIGNVQYTINVVPEEVATAGTLPIQLWITNNIIEGSAEKTTGTWHAPSGSTARTDKNAYYISVAAAKAYGEEGVPLSALVPAQFKRYEYDGNYQEAAATGKDQQTLVFWSGRVHTKAAGNLQSVWGTDRSNEGTLINYVRYWKDDNGAYRWQVSPDRKNWTDVTGEGSTGSYSNCTEQLVAYYMIRTKITNAVTTDVADWGSQKGSDAYNDQLNNTTESFVLLDFAVKYTDDTRVPNTFPVDGKTLAYHCKDGDGAVGTEGEYNYRKLNNFRGVETSNYEVVMITVTMTDDAANKTLTSADAKSSYTYDGQEMIVWAIDNATHDKYVAEGLVGQYTSISGADSAYSGCTIGGDAYVRGVEVYDKHGALITYYVREKETQADKLTVEYYVQGETEPFHSYTIKVKPGTTFDEGFHRDIEPLRLENNTVENIVGDTQTVKWNLSEMTAVPAAYRYVDYEFVDAKRETDGKTVKLYYTITAEKTFVVDFGLPLTIAPKDVNDRLSGAGVTIDTVRMGRADAAPKDYSTEGCTTDYASIKQDGDGSHNVIYTLKEPLDAEDTFGLQYTGTLKTTEGGTEAVQDGTTAKYTITIIPAANVYYEDSFATFYDAGAETARTAFDKSTATDTPGVWYYDGAENNASPDQALEVLGGNAAGKNVYGYDPVYDSCTTFSMGSAKKVTVSNKDTSCPKAEFTFKGTGFDVISLTDNTSGAIMVDVYKGSTATGTKVKSYFVNNYYGYTYTEGIGWEVKPENGQNALYQIPVMKVTDLTYAEYTVVITAAYSSIFDTADAGQYSFWLDAIRVYDPMGETANEKYQQDGEGWPQYIRLRNALAGKTADIAGEKNVLFIDGREDADLEDYTHYGPNNEVYLLDGQAISFKLNIPDGVTVDSVQIGAKAPMDTEKGAVMQVNKQLVGPTGKDGEITSATEMYYDITNVNGVLNDGTVTITNYEGAGILSLTNLKITFKKNPGENEVTLGNLSAEEQADAVQMVRAMYAPAPEPDPEPFAPERFEASWNRGTVKAGQKATLTVKTSEDVDAITVNGETVTTYRTRTQRTGWGWNAKKVTYREFTYTITANETAEYTIAAVNAEGVASEPVVNTLTVQAAAQRPGWGGWLGSLFGRWF